MHKNTAGAQNLAASKFVNRYAKASSRIRPARFLHTHLSYFSFNVASVAGAGGAATVALMGSALRVTFFTIAPSVLMVYSPGGSSLNCTMPAAFDLPEADLAPLMETGTP